MSDIEKFVDELRELFEYGASNSDLISYLENWQAARAQQGEGLEPVAEIKDYGSFVMRATVRHLVDLTQFPDGTKLYTRTGKAQGVPEVATEEMLNEGVQALERGLRKFPDNYTQIVSNIWEDMAAAHTQPSDKPEGEWVKCWYRLPTIGVWVSGLSDTGKVIPAMLVDNGDSAFFRTANDEISEGAIVAWQPLPAAPDMGGEK